jgi:hypothetical protein
MRWHFRRPRASGLRSPSVSTPLLPLPSSASWSVNSGRSHLKSWLDSLTSTSGGTQIEPTRAVHVLSNLVLVNAKGLDRIG